MKPIIKKVGIGALAGLLISSAYILFLLLLPNERNGPPYGDAYSAFCKPLEWGPVAKLLADQQTPTFSLGLMIVYWTIIGAILGALTWAVLHLIRKMK